MAQLSWEVIQIPMRDGRNLIADLYLPNDIDTFPVVFVQTPYGKNFSRTAGLPLGIWHDLPKSPFAFVVMDWRCRFASIGACNPDAERGEDGYDAVEWIASQPWCNGKIGTVG
ncbi:MAG: CocE/NonD family hydrolase, partial [Saprospiraceae bacterium]|nr:CocE/NonD family hydrolase [Saprospiraceae bacterium]